MVTRDKVVGVVVTAAGEVVSAGWDDKLRFADLGGKVYLSEVILLLFCTLLYCVIIYYYRYSTYT